MIASWRIMSVAAMSHDAALDAGTCMDGRWRKTVFFSRVVNPAVSYNKGQPCLGTLALGKTRRSRMHCVALKFGFNCLVNCSGSRDLFQGNLAVLHSFTGVSCELSVNFLIF